MIWICGFSADMRPGFMVYELHIYGFPMEDERGQYYNVSVGTGKDRQDFFPSTALEAYRLIKSLLK